MYFFDICRMLVFPNKAANNEKKYGITFSEALTVFGDPLELTISDPDHSLEEFRFLSIGKSSTGRLQIVSYTEREDGVIRIISSRKATRLERKQYEHNQ